MPPPPLSPSGQPLADFGSRLLAYLIDTAIVSAVAMVVFTPVIFIFIFSRLDELSAAAAEPYGPQPEVFGDFIGPLLLIELGLILLILAANYVYYVEMLKRSGQTVGKRVMKVRVVPIDSAVRLTRTMAAKRYLVEFVAGAFIPLFSYLDGLWQLWDKPYQQTLHDKVAQTVVIKVSA